MKDSFIFGLVVILIVFSISNVSSIFALTEDSFVLNATGIPYTVLGEEDSNITEMELKFSSSNSVCQSTTCIGEIPDGSSLVLSAPTGTQSHINFW